LIAELWAVVRDWKTHFRNSGVNAVDVDKVASAFRHIDDISSEELRREMP